MLRALSSLPALPALSPLRHVPSWTPTAALGGVRALPTHPPLHALRHAMKKESPEAALRSLDALHTRRLPVPPDLHAHCIHLLVEAGRRDAALTELLRAEAGCPVGHWAYKSLLRHARGKRQVERGFAVMEAYKAAGYPADRAMYNDLVAACVGAGRLEEASALVSGMAVQGLQPSRATVTPLLFAHLRAGDLPSAQRFFKRMADIDPHVHVDPVLLAYAVQACLEAPGEPFLGGVAAFGGLLEALIDTPEFGVFQFSVLLRARAGAGDLDAAFAVFDAMMARGDIDKADTGGHHAILARACFDAGKPDAALRVVHSMTKSGVEASVHLYVTLIGGLLDADRHDDALQVLSSIPHDAPEYADTLQFYFVRVVETGQWKRALAALNNLELFAESHPWAALTALTRHAVLAGDAAKAFKLFSDGVGVGWTPPVDAFKLMLWACMQEHMWQEAATVLHWFYDAGHPRLEVVESALRSCGIDDFEDGE